MDKDAFKAQGWWLTADAGADSDIDGLRDELAEAVGLKDGWFADEDELDKLYDYLEKSGGSSLLSELDDAAADVAQQKVWLGEVVVLPPPADKEEKQRDQEEPKKDAAGDSAAVGAAAAAAPRTVEEQPAAEEKAAEEDHPKAGQPSGGTAEAAVAETHAARAPATPAHATAAQTAAAPASAAPTWNAEWGMFLRFENGAYQYSLSSLLSDAAGTATPAGQPDGNWRESQEEAAAARKNQGDVKSVLGDLVADEDAPFSEEDLEEAMKTPGFMEQVEAAMRNLSS